MIPAFLNPRNTNLTQKVRMGAPKNSGRRAHTMKDGLGAIRRVGDSEKGTRSRWI
jgi:hypothetical protein